MGHFSRRIERRGRMELPIEREEAVDLLHKWETEHKAIKGAIVESGGMIWWRFRNADIMLTAKDNLHIHTADSDIIVDLSGAVFYYYDKADAQGVLKGQIEFVLTAVLGTAFQISLYEFINDSEAPGPR
jgi:hypothetical protein